MQDLLIHLLIHPFTIGLLTGLSFSIIMAINGWKHKRTLKSEINSLYDHLHNQMKINAKGNESQLKELEDLKEKNENLRISLATLKNRPDRAELKTLYVYDKAIHLMYEKAPGFAPAWESILKDAEIEINKVDTGILAWVRKTIRPSSLKATNFELHN